MKSKKHNLAATDGKTKLAEKIKQAAPRNKTEEDKDKGSLLNRTEV